MVEALLHRREQTVPRGVQQPRAQRGLHAAVGDDLDRVAHVECLEPRTGVVPAQREARRLRHVQPAF